MNVGGELGGVSVATDCGECDGKKGDCLCSVGVVGSESALLETCFFLEGVWFRFLIETLRNILKDIFLRRLLLRGEGGGVWFSPSGWLPVNERAGPWAGAISSTSIDM